MTEDQIRAIFAEEQEKFFGKVLELVASQTRSASSCEVVLSTDPSKPSTITVKAYDQDVTAARKNAITEAKAGRDDLPAFVTPPPKVTSK